MVMFQFVMRLPEGIHVLFYMEVSIVMGVPRVVGFCHVKVVHVATLKSPQNDVFRQVMVAPSELRTNRNDEQMLFAGVQPPVKTLGAT